jgi:hypothetical protein
MFGYGDCDGLFIANIANEDVKSIAMNKNNKLTENLFLFDIVDIFTLKIPIVLTGSSPDITNPAEYKKAVKGLRDIYNITPKNTSLPIGFGASMKRPGIKNKALFSENFLTIGDNLTVAAMVESIKDKITRHGVSPEDDTVTVLITGPTGFIGSELTQWILQHTKWYITAKSTDPTRFYTRYTSHPEAHRIDCLASFDHALETNFDIAVLATHIEDSIPPLAILKKMSESSLILDVCTPNIYSPEDLISFKGRYYSSISVQTHDLQCILGNNDAVGHDKNTIWPCFCELALAIKENFRTFTREELLDVSLNNINKMHEIALSNKITYKFNIEI